MLRLLAAAGLLVLAGCAGPAPLASPLGGAIVLEEDSPVMRMVSRDMTLEQGATLDVPTVGHAWVESGSSGRVLLELPPGAEAILLELVVRGGDGRLLLHAVPPSTRDATPVLVDAGTAYARQAEDGTARLLIPHPEPGLWAADAHADGVAQRMDFTIYMTSFSGPVPPDFTAIEH